MSTTPRTDRCGTVTGYKDHQQAGTPTCQRCKDIVARKEVNYRKRVYLARGPMLIDATGTRRRLQALSALGWTAQHIGEAVGGFSAHHAQTLYGRAQVHRRTAAVVAAAYDKLSGTPGPSKIGRERALAKGWAPPLAWDEGTIDDPRAVSSTEVEAAHLAALREDELRAKRAGRTRKLERVKAHPALYEEYLRHRREQNLASKRRQRAREAEQQAVA